ncbi:hypothetical protein ASPTUDRAFT_137520 [Aspergillus tubingensis CBS 134.48]|uniref:Carboxypeptidase n=1 Tax=Aspergillus tubingensis (strain CBS 134.48) TaxID=767770 RepID=A0A1L9NDV4_ASPTC|nr:hypothetical protein ASPTUDRAFT_137520 [Aspergillus tubingensis CBS 134.48]
MLLTTSLVALAQAEHIKIQSKFSSDHVIRIKEHQDGDLCNSGSKHYTGLIDISHKHLFVWFQPIRYNNPDAPLAIWLQGGPGGSSIVGSLLEHGSCSFSAADNSTVFNKLSWTEEFNMLYISEPVPVGFSYVDKNETEDVYPSHAWTSAIDFVASVRLTYEIFTDEHISPDAPLYLSGESYAGRWVPTYAAAILDYNERASQSAQIPLQSIMVGNGYTSPKDIYPSHYEVACFEVGGVPAFLNISQCEAMEMAVDHCVSLLDACQTTLNELIYSSATQFCYQSFIDPVANSTTNMHDRTKKCPNPMGAIPNLNSWRVGSIRMLSLKVLR